MEFSTAMVAASLVVSGVTFAWKALYWVWFGPRKLEKQLRQQGLSGNSYRFLIGDLINTIKMRGEARSEPMEFSNDTLFRVDPILHHTLRNHGKNSFIWLGPIAVVIVSEPESIKEIFSRIDDFPKPYLGLAEKLVSGLASYNGEKWAKHRKLINPAFHAEKLKLMLPAFHASCKETINTWEKMAAAKTGSVEMDVWPHLVNLTSDVISRAAFSSSYASGRDAFQLIDEQAQAVFSDFKYLFIPGWRYVPTKANLRFYENEKQIREKIRDIIVTRMKEMEAGEATKNDLLGMMLESNIKEVQQQGSKETRLGMTVEEMIDECKFFCFAGQESISSLIAYTMILLSKHTDWQERARREIMQTFGKNKPDFNGLNHLKTMTMILYEVLRLYPPAASLWRKVETVTKLRNLSLPAGAFIILPMMPSHHDAHQWGEDAVEFKPERFSEGISNATKGNTFYFPFAMGPRVCLGQNFAMIEAKMALAMILQCFSFELSPSYAHAPTTIVTIRPQLGVHLVLHQL